MYTYYSFYHIVIISLIIVTVIENIPDCMIQMIITMFLTSIDMYSVRTTYKVLVHAEYNMAVVIVFPFHT